MQVLKYAKLMGYVRIGLKGKYGQHGEGILIDQTQFGRCKYWLSQEKKKEPQLADIEKKKSRNDLRK